MLPFSLYCFLQEHLLSSLVSGGARLQVTTKMSARGGQNLHGESESERGVLSAWPHPLSAACQRTQRTAFLDRPALLTICSLLLLLLLLLLLHQNSNPRLVPIFLSADLSLSLSLPFLALLPDSLSRGTWTPKKNPYHTSHTALWSHWTHENVLVYVYVCVDIQIESHWSHRVVTSTNHSFKCIRAGGPSTLVYLVS